MIEIVLEKQKTKNYIIMNIIAFIGFMVIYSMIDLLNLSYSEMRIEYGTFLPIVNIFINIVMSALSALMITFSSALFHLTKKQGKGSNLSFVSIIFGMLTYGCTPCIIAFFAAIGITFSVAILPLAGLPYKLVSLVLVIIGMVWLLHSIKHIKCNINEKQKD